MWLLGLVFMKKIFINKMVGACERPVFTEAVLANNFYSRLRGLLGRRGLANNQALAIEPCNSVHTMWMRFPIDVIFLDRNKKVVKIKRRLEPYRTASSKAGHSVVEVAAGVANIKNITVGDQLIW